MSTIGLIGAGKIGSGLARMAIGAGHHVVLSNSRGPESLADLVAGLGERARAATPAQAALAGDLIVASLPLYALQDVPAAELAGKVVIDTSNSFSRRWLTPRLPGKSRHPPWPARHSLCVARYR
ncbi:NAD(P)-binding domain-containing protein [Nonomuraea fuscirosea]|uniref:NADPH-dependent F420 reductase n=1 Tax=Nonomuraea fuscirosea TaxID=1291556 RepID=UPI002DD84297|nr:NAD(P)-binding domain-containing protein [Nonomuraea fuscirosea]WSA56849.1 NAD(P)-binding domain-containing protein [Nonomuraea fuscirosea]